MEVDSKKVNVKTLKGSSTLTDLESDKFFSETNLATSTVDFEYYFRRWNILFYNDIVKR